MAQPEIYTTTYILNFKLTSFDELDSFALLACQKYNLGNDTVWFNSFRGGLYGFYSRIYGIAEHYRLVHSWIPRQRLPTDIEYHSASILFNMDSAFECFIYALNALGHATSPRDFRDVTSRQQLIAIVPQDILGVPSATSSKKPLKGYSKIFPSTQTYCLENYSLLKTIVDLHHVSKHRRTIYSGGRVRSDPPPGFYESLGIAGKGRGRVVFCPAEEIILKLDPKAPDTDRIPAKRNECPTIEGLSNKYVNFIHQLGRYALADAKANIELSHTEFLRDK